MNGQIRYQFGPLNSIADVLGGFAFKSQWFQSGGDKIIRIGDIVNEQINQEDCVCFDATKYKIPKYCKTEEGDILMALSGATTGKIGIVKKQDSGLYVNQRIAIIRGKTLAGKNYLKYVFSGKNLQKLLLRAGGAAQANLSPNSLKEMEIPLPAPTEQKRIAAILDKADAIRRKRRQAIQLADGFLRSVFLDMFGDLINNSKGWPHARFGDICESRLGKMLDSKRQTGNHKKKYLRNANLQWDYFDLTDLLEMDFDEKDKATFSLKYGDLLICEGGEVGRAAIWRSELPECYFQKALHRARLTPEKATPEFLLHLLWIFSKNGGFRDHTTSATIAHLTGVKLKDMIIPLPPLTLQKKFSDYYFKIKSINEKYSFLLTNGQKLFDSISQRAFRGEF